MFNLCFNVFKILLVLFLYHEFIPYGDAGVCWLKRMANNKCKNAYSKNLTWKECCGGTTKGAGYTEKELSEVEFFFAIALDDGAICQSCLESCENASCGQNKRCIMRKGRPKCICSPTCRPSSLKQSERAKDNNDTNKIIFNKNRQLVNANHKLLEFEKGNNKYLTPNNKLLKANNKKNKNNNNINNKNKRVIYKNNQRKRRLNNNNEKDDEFLNRDVINLSNSTTSSSMSQLPSIAEATPTNVQYLSNYNLPISGYHQHRHRANHNNLSTSEINNVSRGEINWYNQVRTINYARKKLVENPVCGTDGKTYKTECQLKKRACRQNNKMLTVSYRGHCKTSCQSVTCTKNKNCLEDQNASPHCVSCMKKCPNSSGLSLAKRVCGIDGNTYPSPCHIKLNSCKTGRAIAVAYRGPCIDQPTCSNIKCSSKQTCLPDFKTHKPRCVSCNYKCSRKRRAHGIPPDSTKLCGSNNATYFSWCQMRKDSCATKFYIDVEHQGDCKHADSQ